MEYRDERQAVGKGERATITKHQDNLKTEGAFSGERKTMATKGERAQVVRHADNLHLEGEMQKREKHVVLKGERASVAKHDDNLKIAEGKFAGRQGHHQGRLWPKGRTQKGRAVVHRCGTRPDLD